MSDEHQEQRHYYEQIAELRREAAQRQQNYLVQQANDLNATIADNERIAAEHAGRGERDDALYWAEQANETQKDLNQVLAQLPPESPISDAKREWLAARQDILPTGNPQAMQTAGWYHDYVTRNMGVADDSPEYFECMRHALEPTNYQPLPTPDDVVKMLGISAKDYNKGVARLLNAKARGEYPDK